MADVSLEIETIRAVRAMRELTQELREYTSQSRKSDRATDDMEDGMKKTEKQASRTSKIFKRLAAAAAAYFTIRAGAAVIRSMAEYEQRLVAVGKTTNIAGRELEILGKRIQAIAAASPLTISNLLEIASAAGQLGVTGTENILVFTETMAKLERATDIVGEEGSKQVARLIGVVGEAIDTVPRFGAVLTELGNTSRASEAEILKVALEVGKATAVFDVSSTQALAYGATLKSIGVEAELAASSMSRSFNIMNKATREGGELLERLGEITGMTGDEFRQVFQRDAAAAFNALIRGLGQIDATGGDVIGTMESIGLSGLRINRVIPPLAKNFELLAEKFVTANQEAKEQDALNVETARSFDTLDGSLTRLGNTWDIWMAQLAESNDGAKGMVDLFTELAQQITGVRVELERADAVLSKGVALSREFLQLQPKTSTGLVSGQAPDVAALERQQKLLDLLRKQLADRGEISTRALEQVFDAFAPFGGPLSGEPHPLGRFPFHTPLVSQRAIDPRIQESGADLTQQTVSVAEADQLLARAQALLRQRIEQQEGRPDPFASFRSAPTRGPLHGPQQRVAGGPIDVEAAAASFFGVDPKVASKGADALREMTAERERDIELLKMELKLGRDLVEQDIARQEARAAAREALGIQHGGFDARVFDAGEKAARQVAEAQRLLGKLDQKEALASARQIVEQEQKSLDLMNAKGAALDRLRAEQTLLEAGLSKEHDQYEAILELLTKINGQKREINEVTQFQVDLANAARVAQDAALNSASELVVNIGRGGEEARRIIRALGEDLARLATRFLLDQLLSYAGQYGSSLGGGGSYGPPIQPNIPPAYRSRFGPGPGTGGGENVGGGGTVVNHHYYGVRDAGDAMRRSSAQQLADSRRSTTQPGVV